MDAETTGNPDEENRGEGTLSAKQEAAIVALLSEQTIRAAAARIEVTERTLYRWLREPEFAAAFRADRREAYGQAIGTLQRFAPYAVNTLGKVMSDPSASHASRVSAATAVLRLGRKAIELDDLHGRIESLEQRASETEGSSCELHCHVVCGDSSWDVQRMMPALSAGSAPFTAARSRWRTLKITAQSKLTSHCARAAATSRFAWSSTCHRQYAAIGLSPPFVGHFTHSTRE